VVKILPRNFYIRPTLTVAYDLLGARLVRIFEEVRLAGTIIEVEAYISEEDLACHAKSGKTKRNEVMYGPPGHAYVYFTYGMHWMLNVVTEREGYPAAILIRAIKVSEGADIVAFRRQGGETNGPGKVTQAFGINGSLNGACLCDPASGLWIEAGTHPAQSDIITGPRVGLKTVPEPWKSIPWRFRYRR